MLEKIKELEGKTIINFLNKASKTLYGIDSLNLIIGDNGSGKTQLIRSIIQDLTSGRSPEKYIALGKTDRLGVIYYTSVPFHKEIPDRKNDSVTFIDISKVKNEYRSFYNAARDYIEVTEKLKINNKLRSVKVFDFTETASILIDSVAGVSASRSKMIFSKELLKLISDTKELQRSYDALTEQKNSLEDSWYEYAENSAERKQIDVEINIIESELEYVAVSHRKSNNSTIDRFIYESSTNSATAIIRWITTSYIISRNSNKLVHQKLAKRIYENNFSNIDDDASLAKIWLPAFKAISSFVKFITNHIPDGYEAHRGKAIFNIDVPLLLSLNHPHEIIETANKFGLLNIGFDSVSSGEAVILHQITNIAHGIHSLYAQGKRNFLIIIDEADMLLHLKWQQQYIEMLTSKLSQLQKKLGIRSLQLIIATHSPMLATDVLKTSITRLKSKGALPSFGSPLQKIVNYSFNTESIGLIAKKTIKKLNDAEEFNSIQSYIVRNIDDDFIREHLMRKADL